MAVSLHVGTDWARRKHDWVCLDEAGKEVAGGIAAHTVDGLAGLVTRLQKLAGERDRMRVVVERTDGALVTSLLQAGLHVFLLSPGRSAAMRKVHFLEGKDDVRDARTLAEASRTNPTLCRPLNERSDVEELRVLLRLRDQRVAASVATDARLQELLSEHFPGLREATIGNEFWTRKWFARAFVAWNDAPEKPGVVAQAMASARGCRKDAAVVEAGLRGNIHASTYVRFEVVEQLAEYQRVQEQVDRYERSIEAVLRKMERAEHKAAGEAPAVAPATAPASGPEPEQPSRRLVSVVRTVPGLGTILVAGLLVHAGHLLEADDVDGLRAYSGVAPSRYQSGSYKGRVMMRRKCNTELRNLLHLWAAKAVQYDPVTCARYHDLRRTKGQAHALRMIGCGLIELLMSMLRHQRDYDPAHRTARRPPAAA